MYVHVKKMGDVGDLEHGDPLALVADGRVELRHSECVAGGVTIEDDRETVTLVCAKCAARQDLDREEAVDALRRVLLHDEYAWGGDAGFLPD
ncbi:MAG TPA: hypothetical protein VGG06_22315 [Thermoanaerobaculia bacterium]|jgi:hypothetical protein